MQLIHIGGKLSKLVFKHALLAAITAAALLTLPVGASAATPHHSCAKRGLKTTFRNSEYAVLERKVRDKAYEDNARYDVYVCSRSFGRFVHIGEIGISGDGPSWSYPQEVNDRYAAVVSGYGGNAGGDTDTNVAVVDLKTGRSLSSSDSSGTPDVWEQSVSTVALAPNGSVAWTANYYSDSGPDNGPVEELWLRRVGSKKPVLVSSGKAPVAHLMRWTDQGKRLLWTSTPRSFNYTPRKPRRAKPLKRGRCTRPGDRILVRGDQYVYLSRDFNASGWKNGVALIACSRQAKRRVTIARSGTHEGVRYSFDTPTVDSLNAAVVTRAIDSAQNENVTIASYDLGRSERICRTAIARDLENVRVPKLLVDYYGTMAWTARGTAAAGAGQPVGTTELGICDGTSARVLARGADLDENLLRIDDASNRILTADLLNRTP